MEAKAEIARVQTALPFPDDVMACLVQHTATDESALASAKAARLSKPASLGPILEAGQRCIQQVRAGPEFARSLQEQRAGHLTAAQLACASKAYAALDAGQLADAVAAASNPTAAAETGADPVPGILRSCDISPSGN